MKERGLVHGGDIYSHANRDELIDFSANINPLGMPPAVVRAAKASLAVCGRYPDPLCRDLRSALGAFHGMPPEWIVCGNGAADVIYRLVLALRPKTALVVEPTFSEYREALQLAGCAVTPYGLRPEDGFMPDDRLFAALESRPELVFLCNPNNPTGLAMPKEFVLRLAERCRELGIRLVADECFTSFLEREADVTVTGRLGDFPNVLVLKAFTKMYAMAGIRLGYALCSDTELVGRIAFTGQPWSVSAVASACGIAALGEGAFVEKTRCLIAENRRLLAEGLAACTGLGLKVWPSQANYVFFYSARTDLCGALLPHGILLRSCANYPGLDAHYYRAAVKSRSEIGALLKALHTLAPRSTP